MFSGIFNRPSKDIEQTYKPNEDIEKETPKEKTPYSGAFSGNVNKFDEEETVYNPKKELGLSAPTDSTANSTPRDTFKRYDSYNPPAEISQEGRDYGTLKFNEAETVYNPIENKYLDPPKKEKTSETTPASTNLGIANNIQKLDDREKGKALYFEMPEGHSFSKTKSFYTEEWEKRQKEIEKSAKELPGGYKEPGVIGQVIDSIKLSTASSISAVFSSFESLGYTMGNRELTVNSAYYADKYKKVIAENPEWQEPQSDTYKGTPSYYARLISGAVPSIGGTLVAATVGTFVGGPTGGAIAGFTFAKSLEGGSAYDEARRYGASPEEANKIAQYVGNINGILEYIPIGRLLNKSKVGKQLLDNIYKRIAKEMGKQGITESITEGGQEVVLNAFLMEIDENRGLFDNVMESLIAGGGAGILFGGGATIINSKELKEQLKKVAKNQEGFVDYRTSKEGKSFEELKKAKKITADDINFHSEDNENGGKIYAAYTKSKPREYLGSLEVEEINGKLKFENLDTEKVVQRKGVMTELIDQVKKDYEIDDIKFGLATDEGFKFIKSLDKGVKQPKALSGAEQLKAREDEKLARETVKIKKESLTFYEEDFETQYQQFKKLITPKKLREISEETQLKRVLKAPPEKIDNILYSQERTGDEVFQMFKERRILELEPLPKVSKETRAMISEKARSSILTEKEKVNRRREFVKSVKTQFGLSDQDLKNISRQDIRLMSDYEFKQYLDNARQKAVELADTRQAKNALMDMIRIKDLKKIENYRKAMALPPISKMTPEQMSEYMEALEQFKTGDTFLSVRQLELVDKTNLKGIRTVEQARKRLAEEMGKPLDEVNNIKVGTLDTVTYDTALAEKSPFYELVVNRTHTHLLNAEASFLNKEKDINRLAKAAEKSRGLTLKQKAGEILSPTNPGIISYIQAPIEDKKAFAEQLSKAELDYASYIEQYMSNAYDYLLKIKELYGSRFVDQYFTHMRKSFPEHLKTNGLLKAFQNAYESNVEDQLSMNIINQDTGQILNKQKFFKFTLLRVGNLDPSMNVTKVFKTYVKMFELKRFLDEMIVELDIYTSSLPSSGVTKKGLEMDRSMKTFMNKYLNNKKGNKETFGGLIKQSGPIDIALRTGNMLVTLKDLGLNIGSSMTSVIGEQFATYQSLGKIKYAKAVKRRIYDTGIKRVATKKGSDILKNYENLTGRNILSELFEPGKDISEKAMQGVFSVYIQGSVEANKLILLGNMTKAEWQSGKLSTERLAQIKLDAGRWRDMGSQVKSIVGSTSTGKSFTKYKGWALPIMRTTVKDITTIIKKLKNKKFKEAVTGREMAELYRIVEMSAFLIIIGNYLGADDKDDSFYGKLKAKAYRESMTILGGLNFAFLIGAPRLLSWLVDFSDSIIQIIKLEEYKTDSIYGDKGDLKGVGALKRQVTPRAIGQFKTGESSSSYGPPGGSSSNDSWGVKSSSEKLRRKNTKNKIGF
jgi:hypothetical protein